MIDQIWIIQRVAGGRRPVAFCSSKRAAEQLRDNLAADLERHTDELATILLAHLPTYRGAVKYAQIVGASDHGDAS